MEASKPTDSPSPTPEQLLQLLDLELARERSKRPSRSPRNRASILAVGITVIMVGAGIALLLAQHLLAEARPQDEMPVSTAQIQEIR